ncbi:19516_t:CDS:2 [Funneliformis geosporum]|uniref:18493_t:CDS:1 n=1 Tax=Funneliformis geosporum TaxID=1117311 RepID=A0A9W4WIR2_9GLOM|nr:19516_t:CDS:2 [Funneliformis geosporum]CAI2164818.1 18493_t:CDS:2 [Funneliformis geosporum]
MSSGQTYTDKDAFFVDSFDNIKIEVLHYPPANIISNYPPIIFIHGAAIAAWAWDNFCRLFSNKGHDCYAMSFRGHGQSTKTPKKDKWWSLNVITNDVSAVTDAIIARTGYKPVLVGHSLGGGVVQNYLKDNQQKALSNSLLTVSNAPILAVLKAIFTLEPYAIIESPKYVKRATLSKAFPDSMTRKLQPKLEKASFVTGMFELLKPFVDPSIIKCPMIVIGAEEDKIFDIKGISIKETAEAYGVEFDIIGAASHSIMLDLTWEDAADVIFNRIQEKIVKI